MARLREATDQRAVRQDIYDRPDPSGPCLAPRQGVMEDVPRGLSAIAQPAPALL